MLNEIDLSRVDLNLLVMFEAVLAERSVSRAAERLNLSPSAVSHALGRLRRLMNDPLFLKTPKGVAPTERALALAEPIADILARMRRVVASAEPFDPARSRRRFTLAMPDAVAAVLMPPLLSRIATAAPRIDLGVIGTLLDRALGDLDSRRADIAIQPLQDTPARFLSESVYVEEFAIAVRREHPLQANFSLARYCEYGHIVVSTGGNFHGLVDDILTQAGLQRRVAVSVPNFLLAMTIVAETDLVAAVPTRLLATHADRYGIQIITPPAPWGRAPLHAIIPRAALMDEGSAWMFRLLRHVAKTISSS
jgi:DNA-binding transcriptional LysR family regulator